MANREPEAIAAASACGPQRQWRTAAAGLLASRGMRLSQGKKAARRRCGRRARRRRPSVRTAHHGGQGGSLHAGWWRDPRADVRFRHPTVRRLFTPADDRFVRSAGRTRSSRHGAIYWPWAARALAGATCASRRPSAPFFWYLLQPPWPASSRPRVCGPRQGPPRASGSMASGQFPADHVSVLSWAGSSPLRPRRASQPASRR